MHIIFSQYSLHYRTVLFGVMSWRMEVCAADRLAERMGSLSAAGAHGVHAIPF